MPITAYYQLKVAGTFGESADSWTNVGIFGSNYTGGWDMDPGDNITQVITLGQTTELTLTAQSKEAGTIWDFYRSYGHIYYWKIK